MTKTHTEFLAALLRCPPPKRKGTYYDGREYYRARHIDMYPERVLENFYARQVDGMWDGYNPSSSGYCMLGWQQDCTLYRTYVHIVAWRLHHQMEVVPDEYEIHHECDHGPLCVVGDHLEKMTWEEHQRRHGKVPASAVKVYKSRILVK